MRIGNAAADELGGIAGAAPGDQTGREICVREWYASPWDTVLRCRDAAMREKAAEYMEAICADAHFGYSQVNRWTGYESIRRNGGAVAGAAGDFDCSSLCLACYALAGMPFPVVYGYTGNMAALMCKTGLFDALTEPEYLTKPDALLRGDILLNTKSHAAMALDDGAGSYPLPSLRRGSRGELVTAAQLLLLRRGQKLPEYGADGDYGAETEAAVRAMQAAKGLAADGVVARETWEVLLG